MILRAGEGRIRSMTVVASLGVHWRLARRLSGPHVVDALLQVEWQLVLMRNLRNDVSRVAR
jgi:hypothetical protein